MDTPNQTPARREPKPGEYFEFLHGHNRYLVELRDHGPYGVEAQVYRNEEFAYGRRFDPRLEPGRPPRERAIAWAEAERKGIQNAERDTFPASEYWSLVDEWLP